MLHGGKNEEPIYHTNPYHVCSIFCILAANEPEDSMILYFSFDELEGKTVIDHSQYGNDGDIIGSPEAC